MGLPRQVYRFYHSEYGGNVITRRICEGDLQDNCKSEEYVWTGFDDFVMRMPLGAFLRFDGEKSGRVSASVVVPKRSLELGVRDENGVLKYGVELNKSDFEKFADNAHLFEALRELVWDNSRFGEYFGGIVQGLVLSDRINFSSDVTAVAKLLENGFCVIEFNRSWLERASKDRVKKTLVHELGHCVEHYVRKVKGLARLKGEWARDGENLVPVGAERRAEHFARRVLRKSRF